MWLAERAEREAEEQIRRRLKKNGPPSDSKYRRSPIPTGSPEKQGLAPFSLAKRRHRSSIDKVLPAVLGRGDPSPTSRIQLLGSGESLIIQPRFQKVFTTEKF